MKITKKVIDRVIISFTESEKKKADKYIKDNSYELYATSHNGSNTMLYIGEKEKKMSLSNEKVASVSANLELLNEISAEELKKSIIGIIKRDGLTFGEQSFLNNVINCLLSKRRNRCHYLFVKNMEKKKNAEAKRTEKRRS